MTAVTNRMYSIVFWPLAFRTLMIQIYHILNSLSFVHLIPYNDKLIYFKAYELTFLVYIFSQFWTLETNLSLQIAPDQGHCFVG